LNTEVNSDSIKGGYYDDKLQECEMERTCCTHVRVQKYKVLVGRPEGKRSLEGIGVDESIVLTGIIRKLVGGGGGGGLDVFP
jgi:hypothetical protein